MLCALATCPFRPFPGRIDRSSSGQARDRPSAGSNPNPFPFASPHAPPAVSSVTYAAGARASKSSKKVKRKRSQQDTIRFPKRPRVRAWVRAQRACPGSLALRSGHALAPNLTLLGLGSSAAFCTAFRALTQFLLRPLQVSAATPGDRGASNAPDALHEVTNLPSASPARGLSRFGGAQSVHNNRAVSHGLSPRANRIYQERRSDLEEAGILPSSAGNHPPRAQSPAARLESPSRFAPSLNLQP